RVYRLTDEALEYLSGYNFPGNIRELRNILQVAVAHSTDSPGGLITGDKIRHHLRMRDEFHAPADQEKVETDQTVGDQRLHWVREPALSSHVTGSQQRNAKPDASDLTSLKSVEAQHIADLLRLYRGNRKKVAHAMGVSERTLYRKIKRYQLREVR
ncbi:MAG: helix-turn-helix domain-containing protein, partial [Chromatiales bacterium]